MFGRAGATAHDSVSRLEVDWHLQWFLTPIEMSSWRLQQDTARGAWLRDQLIKRDVKDGQPLGARVAEHFKRLDYVEQNFRLEIPDRARQGLRTGPAVMDNGNTPLNPDTLILAQEDAATLNARMWRDYARWQTDFDDRGVVWMRFGAPEKRIPYTCPRDCIEVREAWLYHIDGKPLLLDFENEGYDGTVEATRLVTGVLGNYFCGLDAYRCMLTGLSTAEFYAKQASNGKPVSLFLMPEQVDAVREDDRHSIEFATTHDDNSVRGDANLRIVSNLHRLWDPISTEPIALVTWALPRR